MCTSTGKPLRVLSLSRLTDRRVVDWAVKLQLKHVTVCEWHECWANHAQLYSRRGVCQYNLQYPMILLVDATLRKHAYSYILKILPPKNENFQIKNSDIFHISAQNIYVGTR